MADDVEVWKTFTEGDTNAVLPFALTGEDGAAVNLTGKTVTLEGRKRGAAAAFAPVTATVTTAASGEGYVSCSTLTSPAGASGEYRCQFRITESGTYYRTEPGKVVVRGEASAGNA